MATSVIIICTAVAISEPTSHGTRAAELKLCTQDINT